MYIYFVYLAGIAVPYARYFLKRSVYVATSFIAFNHLFTSYTFIPVTWHSAFITPSSMTADAIPPHQGHLNSVCFIGTAYFLASSISMYLFLLYLPLAIITSYKNSIVLGRLINVMNAAVPSVSPSHHAGLYSLMRYLFNFPLLHQSCCPIISEQHHLYNNVSFSRT